MLLLSAVALFIVAKIVFSQADPILKGRVVETLSARFQSRVELDSLHVTIAHGLGVTGGGLRIYPPDDVIAAGAKDPLIAIQNFDFRAAVMGLFLKPMHVSSVHVSGLTIHIPPKEYREQAASSRKRHHGKIKIIVGQILCDNSSLIIDTSKPGKDPKQFSLEHIVLHDLGSDKAWPYDATLTNAVPRGDIHAVGTFGPWNLESPGDSAVTGDYIFDHAELDTIAGIGGLLSSTGKFAGQLNRIIVDGAADVPGFQLDTARRSMPLHTRFHAIVDGTSGDTYLQPVDATLGSSHFSCSGAVVNIKGVGHQINLDIDIPAGQIRDFLNLAVKTQPPIMTGTLQMKAKLNIPPGKQSVTRKIGIQGRFVLTHIHFSNPQIEDKVDMLSLRAQGKPHEAHSGAPDVHSQMRSTFSLRSGQLTLPDLNYMLPGATVNLAGQYTLDGRKFNFAGHVRTNAKLSNMVSTWWKSLLLKPVDPFFEKHGAGAEIPVKITGTESAPNFGVDIGRH
ncbi:MAG TPA: AsmA-like C-terminal region-containing protein [Acidobacteriaceae bacterium]